MPEQVPFIGRKSELSRIEGLIAEWDTRRVLCIQGDGGVGKTRLLQEVRRRYADRQETRLLFTGIIDFDDRKLHVPENVERRIMEELGDEALNTYLRRLLDWHKMQLAGVSSEELDEQDEQLHSTLAEQLNDISSERRVVLLMDTMEKLEETEVWDGLTDLILASKNALFLLAGRGAQALYELLCQKIDTDAQLVVLEPLGTTSSAQYLEQKQRQLNVNLAPKLTQRLLTLSKGRPILIDLAIEWASRNVPLDWLTEDSAWETANLSEPEIERRQQEFQPQLVKRIGEIRKPMDRLTLLMSRFYPLNAEMIAKSLDVPLEEATVLLKDAQTYVFVKSLPDSSVYLHDEMRRMVREYVWPEIDPDDERRRADSRLALEYFEQQEQTLTEDIQRFAAQGEQARQEEDAEGELRAFMARRTAEQELWAIREQQLFHTLFIDPQKGIAIFAETFDEATITYYHAFRERLLDQMQRYAGDLDADQIYEIDIRRAKYQLDSGQYKEARKLVVDISSRAELAPARRVDTLIQQANVEIRLGELQAGVDLFKEAVQVSAEHGLKEWLAKAETGLGWAYRLISDLTRAGEHYQIALDLAIETGSKRQQAQLYNNLGFLYTYYSHIPGNSEKALWFCNQALELWRETGDRRGEGRCYSTLGCVTFMSGRFDEALSHFQEALDIFEPAHDREWLSTVYSWRGAVHMSTKRLDLAERDIRRSLEMNIQRDRPMNLSRLGLVHLIKGELDEAQKIVHECRELSLTLHNVWYQLISLRDMARLARHRKEFDQLADREQELAAFENEWMSQDRRALGMLYLNLGSLALGQSDLGKAVHYFALGLKLLAEQGRYGADTTEVHMQRLEHTMVKELNASTEQIREIGTRLREFWRQERLDFDYPDVRILLSRWANWKETENEDRE